MHAHGLPRRRGGYTRHRGRENWRRPEPCLVRVAGEDGYVREAVLAGKVRPEQRVHRITYVAFRPVPLIVTIDLRCHFFYSLHLTAIRVLVVQL